MEQMDDSDLTYKIQLDRSASQYFNDAGYRALDIARLENEIDLINLKISQNETMARIYNNMDRSDYFLKKTQLERDRHIREMQRLEVINVAAESTYKSLVNSLKSLFISVKYKDSVAIMFGSNFINSIYIFISDYSVSKDLKKAFIEKCSFGEVRGLIFRLEYQMSSQPVPQLSVIENFKKFISTPIY